MRVCVFEDGGVHALAPLTLTRPACDLWCGAATLLDEQRRLDPAGEAALLVRPELAAFCRLLHPDLPVNDPAWLADGPAALVNARWLPGPDPLPDRPCVGLAAGEVAFVVPDGPARGVGDPETLRPLLEMWRCRLPDVEAGGDLAGRPWDLLSLNAAALARQFAAVGPRPAPLPDGLRVIGPPERVRVEPWAEVEPFVVADARRGPVWIDCGATVGAFSRLEGPCYVGGGARVLGARVRASSLGPECRVGGEVEGSVLQGFANKAHDGFLGHSYLAAWVNLGAGTQAADLRNDLGEVRAGAAGRREGTGRRKLGCVVGEHARAGVGTLLDCGSLVGPFCHLLPGGGLAPREAPAFCEWRGGRLSERADFRRMFGAAASAYARRGRAWTEGHAEFFLALYERTLPARRAALGEEAPRNGHPARR